jgi:hypothetical protein
VLQQNLARGRRDQIGPAHDVGDPLRVVVDDHRELVGEQAIGASHDKVADVALEVLRLRALQAIAPIDARLAHTKTPRLRGPRRAIRGMPSRHVPA